MRITSKHPVRKELAGLDTYYDSEGDLLWAVHGVLRRHNLRTDDLRLYGEEGYGNYPLYPDDPGAVMCAGCSKKIDESSYDNCIVICWYVTESGRIELTTYIS